MEEGASRCDVKYIHSVQNARDRSQASARVTDPRFLCVRVRWASSIDAATMCLITPQKPRPWSTSNAQAPPRILLRTAPCPTS
eukprot:scaffold1042_cov401-Prasinococcus_capsulatus_cf.AAC.49